MMLGSMILDARGAEAPTSQLVGANPVDGLAGENSSVSHGTYSGTLDEGQTADRPAGEGGTSVDPAIIAATELQERYGITL
jgi:hypothetical protein